MEHFKNPDSIHMPLPIPDPLVMPDRVYSLGLNKVSTMNVTAFGVSRIRVENFTSDLVDMKVKYGSVIKLVSMLQPRNGASPIGVGRRSGWNRSRIQTRYKYCPCKQKMFVIFTFCYFDSTLLKFLIHKQRKKERKSQ